MLPRVAVAFLHNKKEKIRNTKTMLKAKNNVSYNVLVGLCYSWLVSLFAVVTSYFLGFGVLHAMAFIAVSFFPTIA